MAKANPEWEALATLHGWSPGQRLTATTSGMVGKVLRELREAHGPDGLADEIRRRIAAYRKRWPEMECTATALAKHWASLGGPKVEGGAARAQEIRNLLYKGGLPGAECMERLVAELEQLTA